MIALTAGTAILAVLQSAPAQLLIDRNRIDRAPPVAQPQPETAPRTPTAIASAPTGTKIAGIRFTTKAPARVAAAARPFLGRTASRETLTRLASVLSAAYGKADVALYTVAIPNQTFANGVVIVSLTEGRIARAQVKADKKGGFHQLKGRMTPLIEEMPLSRQTMERQFTLMRAIPGLTIDPQFTDPNGDGALVLTVTPKQRKSKLSAGFSNRGVALLGDGQFDLRGEFYGLGVDGDQLTLSASSAPDLKRFRYLSGGYAAPIGTSGLTASAAAAYLETRPRALSIIGPIKGTAKQVNLSLGYPLIRSFHRSADLSVGVDGLDSDNATFGTVIASERTRAARAAASYADAREKRSVSLSASLSHGLDIAGARVTAPLAETGFAKATASAAIGQAIGKKLFVRVSASGQYSRDRLPAAERFAIGGESIGRAFNTSILTGDRGAGALGEIALRPLKTDRFKQSELYTFVDGGIVSIRQRGDVPAQDYSLASAGVGVRGRYKDKVELGLEAARSIDDPYAGYGEDWRISVAYRLNL